MAELKSAPNENEISRDRLAELLNEDLSREYQAIIAYVVYSQVLSGAQYMDIAAQLEIHAKRIDHALTNDFAHCHRLPPECGAGTTSPSGVIPFRNLKRSLPVERTRVVFSAMMDL